jgi:hypothetical protein
MLVFISWSGQRSKVVAEALENWLAQVIQAVEPWISQDIDKGLRWGTEIADRLEHSKVGIICLTKSNLNAKWIHFEAGALSKTKDAYVCTLLLDVKPSDVEQPLAQFQHTTMEKEQIFKLLLTINGVVQSLGEKALPEPRLRNVFETYWPHLEEAFKRSATLQEAPINPSRSDSEMLQEVLEILRNHERRQTLNRISVKGPVVNDSSLYGAFRVLYSDLNDIKGMLTNAVTNQDYSDVLMLINETKSKLYDLASQPYISMSRNPTLQEDLRDIESQLLKLEKESEAFKEISQVSEEQP